MNIFKPKNQITIKNKWEEVTYDEFDQIVQTASSKVDDNFKLLNIISILSGRPIDEIIKLPLETIRRLSKVINFVNTEQPKIKHKNSYKINNTKYNLAADLTQITTAQYMDYTNFMKEEQIDYRKVMAVFLIPDKHQYNDGYDFDKVVSDMGQLNVLDFGAIAFFLSRQFAVYILITADCLKKNLKGIVKKKDIEKIQTQLVSISSCLWYCEFAKLPTHHSKESLNGQ